MNISGRVPLMLAAASSLFIAALHLAIIVAGARGYRYFGAPSLAVQVERGTVLMPALLTAAMAGVFAVWGLYAVSALGVVRRFPLLRSVLVIMGGCYLLRGLLLIPELVGLMRGAFGSARFLVFSAFSLVAGLCYLAGTARAWRRLSRGRD